MTTVSSFWKFRQTWLAYFLTAYGAAKAYIKARFTEWYCACIVQEIDNCKDVESISIQLKMFVLKPLQGKWIIDLFNYFTSEKGREIISKGWKVVFFKEVIFSGTSSLKPLDLLLFDDPLSDESEPREVAIPANEDVDLFFLSPNYIEVDADVEWVTVETMEKDFTTFLIYPIMCDHSNIWQHERKTYYVQKTK